MHMVDCASWVCITPSMIVTPYPLIYYQLHVADEPKPSMTAHRTWAMHSNGQCLWVLWFMSMLQRVCQARLPCSLAARSVFVS